jgi:hypothetical protein
LPGGLGVIKDTSQETGLAHEAEPVLGLLTGIRGGGPVEAVTRGDREARRWTFP